MPEDNSIDRDADVTQVVGNAIQNLTAARLGRAFIPLALVFFVGLGQMLAGAGGFALAAGAPVAAGAKLAYGLRVVERAFGRPRRAWMAAAAAGAVVPPVFGIYVLGWTGLRGIAEAGGFGAGLTGILLSALGVWILRGWVQILELHRLAVTMALGMAEGRGGEG